MKKRRDWEALLAGMAKESGLEILEIAIQKENAGRFLRVFIDKPEGISLQDCESFHRGIIPVLEDVDYDYLEVCSPGADRPLKLPRDYERNLGKQIEVKLFSPRDGQKAFQGILESFDDDSFIIKNEQGEISFQKKEIAIARPVVDVEEALEQYSGEGEEEG